MEKGEKEKLLKAKLVAFKNVNNILRTFVRMKYKIIILA